MIRMRRILDGHEDHECPCYHSTIIITSEVIPDGQANKSISSFKMSSWPLGRWMFPHMTFSKFCFLLSVKDLI